MGRPVTLERYPSSAGLLVLGMHRSGTSALARVLGLGGADLGARVLGASKGNQEGHWEDAVAVNVHDQLLAGLGTRWDEPFGLPRDWAATAAAAEAGKEIRRYVEADRSSRPLWVAKDPRLCLFSSLWRDASNGASVPMSAVLVLRHPAEIAASLFTRDGIGMLRAQLMWLDYMLSAVHELERMDHAVVSYDDFLQDWRRVMERVANLPGADRLRFEGPTQGLVDGFLDPRQRHHHASGESDLLPQVAEAWNLLEGAISEGRLPSGLVADLENHVAPLREVLRPLLSEARVHERRLWERTARAEALIAGDAIQGRTAGRLDDFGKLIDQRHDELVSLLSDDIRHMQAVAAQATARAEVAEGALAAAKAEQLLPLREQLAALELQIVTFYSNDIRRMQDVVLQVTARAEAAEVALQAARDVSRSDLERAALRNQGLQEDVARVTAERDDAETRMSMQERIVDALRTELAKAMDSSDHQQRMLASLAHEVGTLREQAGVLAQIKASTSWRLTRPLRVARRLITGEWSSDDAAKWRDLMRRMVGRAPLITGSVRRKLVAATLADGLVPAETLPDEAMAHDIVLAGPAAGLADVFVWAVIDWRFRTQRPQHLAKALADKGHRVFYMSNNFIDDPTPGFRIDPLDSAGRLFQLHLNLAHAPAIYHAMPEAAQVKALRASLAKVLAWSGTTASLSLVQHPYWSQLVRAVPNAKLVYDCMDHHAGFLDNARDILEAERALLADADLVVVTSSWLEQEISPVARATALVRNAGEFVVFRDPPPVRFQDPDGRRVIGYYGAIADWFDAGLVREVARRLPDALVVLVGSDTAKVGDLLADLANVRMVGEVPYANLPYWLHGFDVCLLPFKVIPLTLATNPVKVYEYLAAGKPVVSVDLPEMAQFGDCVRVATGDEAYARAVAEALAEAGDMAAAGRRQAFAAGQTWGHRAAALDEALATLPEPRVSVVVLTYNNLAFTQACLFSLEAYSDYTNLEVIVVDNASSDGSPEWLREWEAETSAMGHTRRLILNQGNLGFAAGNNVGLREATGETLVILNNDTYVTPGWVRTLCAHLRCDPGLGLVGPVTNNIGNEAKLDIHYADMVQMIALSAAHTRSRPGMRMALATVAFFCVAMRRDVFERVGGLDEQFGLGFFEDDDYCRRVQQAGFGIACAEDVFVHHHLSASFDALKAGQKQALFEKNQALFEAKWGAWTPHTYRQDHA